VTVFKLNKNIHKVHEYYAYINTCTVFYMNYIVHMELYIIAVSYTPVKKEH